MTPAAQLLVIAKAPVPGLVKTRLCPPCTPAQAAELAAAALADTLATVAATPARRRTPDTADAALGLAADGGWWGLGLRDPRHAELLADVPMSTATTGARTLAALTDRSLQVIALPVLRDVDTMADAEAVAHEAPHSRFAMALAALSTEAGVNA